IDVEQDGGFAVCGNDPVNGLHSRNNLAEITDAHRDARRCGLYDHGRNLGGGADLSPDQSQDELMIAFKQAGRVDEVRALDRVENVSYRDARGEQPGRVGFDVKFRFLSSLNQHSRDAVQSIQAWLDVVGSKFPELSLRNRVGGQAVADDRKT